MTIPTNLARELTLRHALAVVVGTIIGSGIFLVPREMMQAAGSARVVYLAWLVGGLLSFFGALTYAELGAMKPEAGGEYIYLRDAYGPLAGFLDAWTWFTIAKPASIATITAGIVRILGTFSSSDFFNRPVLSAPLEVTNGHLLSIGLIVLISAINYVGVRKAGEFQFFFTTLKIFLILTIIAAAFTYGGGNWSNFSGIVPSSIGGISGFVVALVSALWAYDGWNDLNMVAGEIRNPQRNIPLALIGGVIIVALLYVAMNAGVQFVMPAQAIAASERPASDAMRLAGGYCATVLVSVGMAVSMLVTLNGTTMSGARVPFAASRDQYFFKALAEVHPRFRTPSNAIIVQAVLAAIVLLVGGKFQQLFTLAIFSEWLFYFVTASTIFVFRWRDPQLPRPFRVWGYPFVPALFLVCAAVLLVFTFKANLRDSIYGSAVVLAGIPVFYWFSQNRKVVETNK
ncbi:MAG: amino acid permease [Acidobacteriales bacterium]|nr:amino acid permease [Terriglobales bacterium]